MMNAMRKHTKTILWIVVAAFVGTIFFVWGMDAGRQKSVKEQISAAVVNGQAISYAEFAQHWEQRYRQIIANAEEEPSPKEIQRMRSDLMDSLIDSLLLRQAFDKLKLSVTPEEVAAQIYAMPAFRENGVFSQEKYISMLGYNRITPEEFEGDQANMIKLMKMSQLLGSNALVTDDSLKQYYLSRSRNIKLAWVRFQWEDYLKKVTVSDDEISAYFNQNRGTFDKPEEVEASHILLRVDSNASEEDKLTVKLKLDTLRNEIIKGADFATVAKEHSDDPGSKEKGGQLGYFRKGMMVPAFEQAAFSLKPGELSDIIETPFGYHLIKVTGRHDDQKADLAKVKPEIQKTLAEEKARKQSQREAMDFMRRLKDAGHLATAAQDAGLTVSTTSWLAENGSIPGIEQANELIDKALDLPLNKPSSPIQAGPGMYFVETIDEQAGGFDQDRFAREHDQLVERLKRIRGEQLTAAWIKQARADAEIVNNVANEAAEDAESDTPTEAEK